MCNRYKNKVRLELLKAAFDQVQLPLVFKHGAPNLEPRDDIRPTNPAPFIRPLDPTDPFVGVEIVEARWDLVPHFWKQPVKAKKFLATNARCETVATQAAFRDAFKRRRCLVPTDGFYEWTGEKGAKTKWQFTVPGQEMFCIAGLWDRAETADGTIESFTMLTTAPGDDMKPYHDRQVVVLEPESWSRWLDLEADVLDLFVPPPAGTFHVELAP